MLVGHHDNSHNSYTAATRRQGVIMTDVSNKESGNVTTQSLIVQCSHEAALVVAPEIVNFPEVIKAGHEWGGWGWSYFTKVDTILWDIYIQQGCRSDFAFPGPDYRSFRNSLLFPKEKRPFNWVLAQKALQGKLISFHEATDAHGCSFESYPRCELLVLSKWSKAVIELVRKWGFSQLLENKESWHVGMSWDGHRSESSLPFLVT